MWNPSDLTFDLSFKVNLQGQRLFRVNQGKLMGFRSDYVKKDILGKHPTSNEIFTQKEWF